MTSEGHTNEHIRFNTDPCKFLMDSFPAEVDQNYPPSHGPIPDSKSSSYAWPSHLAVFDELLSTECRRENRSIGDWLVDLGYHEQTRFWNVDVRSL
ncbi:hypothetical protein P389DRAFT_8698 [Cystobasidium minutum MCA 4210]|uniref:uncharacterized protein n=1 Tax=Cystobasidium minutum MCA 4210 TaxID=1397322 RepID=UPI0034CE7AF1|eukprot:jgi/Rhomi1/8698/CE8697_103